MDPSTTKSAIYEVLLNYGIDSRVAEELDCFHQTGLLAEGDLDERARDAIKEFSVENALAVLNEFKKSNLEHVTNKSAFLCGVMKTYRQKNKMGVSEGSTVQLKRPGPDETKLKAILDRTGYSLDVTTGQRKYGGPPPGLDGSPPGSGHEIFCGSIPKDIFEDELIPQFEKCGVIWNLRLMMDPLSGYNRGFCFVTFTTRDGAQEAVKRLNGFEIRPGKLLKINISVANVRLFVGNIPKNKSKDDILEEFRKQTDGLLDVIIYSSPDDMKKKNRGFAFLEYDSHKSASMAKHRIGNGWTRVWGCDIIVDWADPLEEPDEETMSKVKVLYVRNLKADVTDDQLRSSFEQFGKVERVKKVKDYGFVHFEDRDNALAALAELNGKKLGESEMQISLAKPPTENKQKEKRRQQYKQIQFTRGSVQIL
jgi:heterogeneous nuclear ribonucleoprotein R